MLEHKRSELVKKREIIFFLDKTTSVWVMQAHISLTLLVTSTSTRQRAHHPPIHPELLTKLAELQHDRERSRHTENVAEGSQQAEIFTKYSQFYF